MAARYQIGCAGMFAIGQVYGADTEDEAFAFCDTGPMGCEVYDTLTRKWLGPTCQEEIDAAKARLSDGEA